MNLVIGLVVLIITVAIGTAIVAGIAGSLETGSAAQNAANLGIEAFANFSSLLPVVGLVGIAVVILGLVIGGFAMRKQ